VLPKDIDRAGAENRRVRLRTAVRGFEDWKYIIEFPQNSDEFSADILNRIQTEADKLRSLLERNEEIIVLFEGFAAKNEPLDTRLAFDRAYKVKKAFEKEFGEAFVRQYGDRLFVYANEEERAEKGKVVLSISGESLIYRPLEGPLAASGYDIEEGQANFVKIGADVAAGVDSFKVSIVDENGNVFRVLDKGTGEIPSGVPWDWKDSEGNLLDPNKAYFAKLEIKDKLGQRATAYSDTVRVNVTKRQEQVETLIIVQFTFDEKISESKFLESRVEYIARKFIEKALEPKKHLTAVVGGHTDVIGLQSRNRQLSMERAAKEEAVLRQHLIYMLGLKNNSELNAWLRAHNTTLTSKGFTDSKPYVITKWEEGQMTRVKIGDNQLPEGRTINRRVVIEFEMEKYGEEKPTREPTP